MAVLGDTFLLAKRGVNDHLFVIISDPAQDPTQIVTANFTSWRSDEDQSCILERGDHRLISHRSCVYYDNRLLTLTQYQHLLATAAIIAQDPVGAELLPRILRGAATSPFIPLSNRQILLDQGLIDRL
jgi:hypothetical protein